MTTSRTLIAGLLFALLIAAGLGWLAYLVEGDRVAQFDVTVRNVIHAHSNPRFTSIMIILSDAGKPLVIGPLSVLIAWLFWRDGFKDRAILFLIAMGGGVVIETVLKLALHRSRPQPFFGYPRPSSYSFPSGHALESFCFCGLLAALLSPSIGGRVNKALLWIGAGLLTAAIGFSRIYLGVHYPTDVIAGYAAAAVWVLFVAIGNGVRQQPLKRL